MNTLNSESEVWLLVGSQNLYGEETLRNVEAHANEISTYLNSNSKVAVQIKLKEIQTAPDQIRRTILHANYDDNCIGLIMWMHTFSPAKMWINGLKLLQKPFAQLHTQYNDKIPWSSINMDFMNENQTAHGGREFGHINARLNKTPKVIIGHWKDKHVTNEISSWLRVLLGWSEIQKIKVARMGDNMREVAVTEGDKVEAQIKFGFSVNGYGLGDVVKHVKQVSQASIKALLQEYSDSYVMDDSTRQSTNLLEAARIELGLRSFLEEGNFTAFTTTFENLHGLHQLPGLAVQRLMQDGYGFGAEGDWKTAAMLRMMKVMSIGSKGGNSFMEDYTYHFDGNNSKVLGAHMLEICPSISTEKPRCEIHPLGIGGKEDPARLVFEADAGPAINVSLVNIRHQFRLIANTIDCIKSTEKMPNLPVARSLWKANPSTHLAAKYWIMAGGSHHTVFSQTTTSQQLRDFAEIAQIEYIMIDKNTEENSFVDRIRALKF